MRAVSRGTVNLEVQTDVTLLVIIVYMQKREIGVLRGLGTRLPFPRGTTETEANNCFSIFTTSLLCFLGLKVILISLISLSVTSTKWLAAILKISVLLYSPVGEYNILGADYMESFQPGLSFSPVKRAEIASRLHDMSSLSPG